MSIQWPLVSRRFSVAAFLALAALTSASGQPCETTLTAIATGTVRYFPELGGGRMDIAPVGGDIQSTYGRTTAENREFRRGFLEFAVPSFDNSILQATLVLIEGRGWTSFPLPPDRHELGYYPADLVLGTNDFNQPVTLLATFETDVNEETKTFEFDVTELVRRFQGGKLGFRIKLAADPEQSDFGFRGTEFLPPRILVTSCTNSPPPVSVVSILARDALAGEGTNVWWGQPRDQWPIAWWANRWQVNQGGTNTATFVVRRSHGTNSDLAVYYALAGTASNGLDYVALPGSVTIPAGRHTARVVLRAIDDQLVEGIETVTVKLRLASGSADQPPAYLIGRPSQASAIIVDNDRARPPCLLLPDHQFHFCLPGTNGFGFRIEASTNLIHWTPVCTNVVTDGAVHFVDPDAPALPRRHYRLLPQERISPDD